MSEQVKVLKSVLEKLSSNEGTEGTKYASGFEDYIGSKSTEGLPLWGITPVEGQSFMLLLDSGQVLKTSQVQKVYQLPDDAAIYFTTLNSGYKLTAKEVDAIDTGEGIIVAEGVDLTPVEIQALVDET